MPYHAAYCLWITPDFNDVMAGRAEPPRVDHDQINFPALADLLGTVFHYGPPKRIQVANDTIDQTTVHTRMGIPGMPRRPGRGTYRCEDFGEALLAAGRGNAAVVIDVRKAWRSLHYLEDRTFAPPPVGIVFLIESEDFEDGMIAGASLRPAIGMQMIGPGFPPMPETEGGRLPDALKEGLEDIFGCPFERECVVDRIAQESAPQEYGDIFNPAVQAELRKQAKNGVPASKRRTAKRRAAK